MTPLSENVAAALREAARTLEGISEAPRLEAEWLMADALECSRSDLLLRHMHDPVPARFGETLARRASGEMLAHVTGKAEFYGLTLKVTPDVLVPRSDTETLIAVAEAHFIHRPGRPRRVLDLGTGSGALLLAALTLWPRARGIGIERSPAALEIACDNAEAHRMQGRALMQAGDWNSPDWHVGLARFDCILANPPYIAETDADLSSDVYEQEPHEALFAGTDGLDDYRALVAQIPRLLAEDGIAVFEIGWLQAEAVCNLVAQSGLVAEVHADLAGRLRAIALTHPGTR